MEPRVFQPLRLAVLTVSDSRGPADDRSGALLETLLRGDGHHLAARALTRDHQDAIAAQLRRWIAAPEIDVIVTTGGTGVTGRDVTPEALALVAEKPIPGFGELFRWLSYGKIGASAIQSRTDAAVAGGTLIFVLPGSPSACRDAWEGILRSQLDSRTRPCNFAVLLPRLREGDAAEADIG